MADNRGARRAVDRALEHVATHEDMVHAFCFLDPELARAGCRRAPKGPLSGVTLGVKDIFDTVDQPTEYGSAIYAGHRPRRDAGAVALLRAGGAVVLGKTVTAELAWYFPGPTTNPHRSTHTPGGSSSGSAAGVAAGMIDLALGTQTAGSVIRPASYCGVFGYKASFGDISTTGVKKAAPSLDTVGLFAREIDLLEVARIVLTGRTTAHHRRPISFGFVRTEQWAQVAPAYQDRLEEVARVLGAVDRELPAWLHGLALGAEVLQRFEGARSLAYERSFAPELLSAQLRALLDAGQATSWAEANSVQRRARFASAEAQIEGLFEDSAVLLTPAAPDEAPEGLTSTGDPRFCRLWTLLGLPASSVPGLVGPTGLPLGVQLVARRGDDALVLAAGRIVADVIARHWGAGVQAATDADEPSTLPLSSRASTEK